jgi:peptidoglycan/xylan/chitin deacetylase (PgdA/CDA1 family)
MTRNKQAVYVLLDVENSRGWRDYGARVGIWHTIDALDRNGIRASVPLTRAAVEQYPRLVEAGRARGWVWLASEIEAVDAIGRVTGTPPRGWSGAGPAPSGLYDVKVLKAEPVVLRPFVEGWPLRYKHLDGALARLAEGPAVWLATSDDIAEAQLTETPTCMLIHCRA